MNDYSPDTSIQEAEEDLFQRHEFAKRICTSISRNQGTECITFGLYGTWGTGKSSILQLIRNELNTNHKNTHVLDYNPWQIGDQNSLMLQFFSIIANEIEVLESDSEKEEKEPEKVETRISKVRNKWNNFFKRSSQLESQYEANIRQLKKYTAPFLGVLNSSLSDKIFDVFGESPNLEQIKDRLEKLLQKLDKRLVIIIDDIDRLDKDEIHILLKLVKQSISLDRITYLLSFDKQVVADAIREKYGSEEYSGESFLEKIIQVPLELPTLTKSQLRAFTEAKLEKAITDLDLEQEWSQFRVRSDVFWEAVFTGNTTPRSILRFVNSLRFHLPMVKDHVYISDFILLQTLHFFHPNYYQFIMNHSFFFNESWNNHGGKDEGKISLYRKEMEILAKSHNGQEHENALKIIHSLFPDTRHHQSPLNEELYSRASSMRISSPRHFDRYFTYQVDESDISEYEIANLTNNIESISDDDFISTLKGYLEKTDTFSVLLKFRSLEKNITEQSAIDLIKKLYRASELFESKDHYFIDSPEDQLSRFIIRLMAIIDVNKREKLFSEVFMGSTSLKFTLAHYIDLFIKAKKKEQGSPYSYNFLVSQFDNLREKARLGQTDTILELPKATLEKIRFLLGAWSECNRSVFNEFIKSFLQKEGNSLILLSHLVPTIYSTKAPYLFKGDLTKEVFLWIQSTLDIRLFWNHIKKDSLAENFKIEVVKFLNTETDDSKDQDLQNMINQFVYWYDSLVEHID